GFDAVVKGADLVTELLRDVDHLRHLVGAIAVIVDEDVATKHFRESLQTEVTLRRIALAGLVPFVPLTPIALGGDPCRAIAGDVPHARRWTARRVDALRILPARHLEPVLGARELHSLRRTRRDHLEH